MNLKYTIEFKQLIFLGSIGVSLMITPMSAMSANEWKNYSSVDRKPHALSRPHASSSSYGYSTYKGYADPYGTPLPPQHYPIRPPVQQQYAIYPSGIYSKQGYYPDQHSHQGYPRHPQQNGLSIIYQQSFPQQTQYYSEQQGFIHGDANAHIESSSYMLISDWRRYNLPDPVVGMHWIYQNGRYLQVPNDR